jgi:hypothetical protein
LAKTFEVLGKHYKRRRDRSCEKHDEECWKNAAGASLVELEQRQFASHNLSPQDIRYQVPADNEEDIDAQKAAREPAETGVNDQDWKDCHRSEAIDLSPMRHCLRWRGYR